MDRRVALLLIIILAIPACSQGLNYGTGYRVPEPVNATIDRTAWLARVKLPDTFTGPGLFSGQSHKKEYGAVKDSLEEALTLSTFNYLQKGNYFKDVRLLPGHVGKDDLVLRFEYDRYIEEAAYHPAEVPFIILFPLLPFYVVSGGPIGREGSDLSGTLVVDDSEGRRLAGAASAVRNRQTISLRSPPAAQVDVRTKILNRLLADALNNIPNSHSP
jgi:hypothetical protein